MLNLATVINLNVESYDNVTSSHVWHALASLVVEIKSTGGLCIFTKDSSVVGLSVALS
jgi:hypothetical protein